MGLWCALAASRKGAQVALIEKRTMGAGASGGLLGALMPHQPTGWNVKKQFQLDGLLSLPQRIAEIEEQTDLPCGYKRVGRLMPIANAEKRRQSRQWATGAKTNWPATVHWRVIDDNPARGLLRDEALSHGANHDTLSARLDPRALMASLAAAVRQDASIQVHEGLAVNTIHKGGAISLADGMTMAPGATIVAAGTSSFPLVDPNDPARIGRGVKGQGALFRPSREIDPAMPIIYDKGVYIVVHDNGLVAIGSTSEDSFDATDTTDEKLDALIASARELCPAIANASLVERWAGVRPRAVGREPLVGPLPGLRNTIAATGGFKISFAIAHLMAEAAVAFAFHEQPANLPEMFLPERRLGLDGTHKV